MNEKCVSFIVKDFTNGVALPRNIHFLGTTLEGFAHYNTIHFHLAFTWDTPIANKGRTYWRIHTYTMISIPHLTRDDASIYLIV